MSRSCNGLNTKLAVVKGKGAEIPVEFSQSILGQLDNIHWTVAIIAGR